MKGSEGWKKFMSEVVELHSADTMDEFDPRHFAVPPQVEKKQKPKKRKGSKFYSSIEWRQLRYKALRLSDGCCNLCGRNRRQHGVVLHVDHIVPRSKNRGLELQLSNLQVLCEDCNIGKGANCDRDWR